MVNILIKKTTVPKTSSRVSWEEFIGKTGIHPLRLSELVEMEWIEYDLTDQDRYLFPEKEIFRVKRLLRICKDFELPTLAGMIIVDLIERIEFLEKQIK